MAQGSQSILCALVVVALAAPHFTAQPSTDHARKERDITQDIKTLRYPKNTYVKPKWGFFGTIFSLILEQVNDTKSAYNQISDLVSNQFVDDNAVIPTPDPKNNGTTPPPKISRAEFLKILDRNLKGLARLRNLEMREAKKDSWANLRGYKEEIFNGKKPQGKR